MNILITGGCGFIGRALIDSLLKTHNKITVVDLTYRDLPTSCTFKYLDIRNYEDFDILGDEEFDFVFHLAAQVSSLGSELNPDNDIDTNIKGTLNLLKFLRKRKFKPKIIFTSSMATYGDQSAAIFEDSPQEPVSLYGISKIAGEKIIKAYSIYGFKFSIFRLFNVYGPGQDMQNMQQGMLSIFLAQARCKNIIDVTGSIKRYRDFVYIDDVVEALLLGLKFETNNEIYNVGSGLSVTVDKLIKLIILSIGKDYSMFSIRTLESHDGDQFGSLANIDKLLKLGWTAKTNLYDGLIKFNDYLGKK